MRINIYQFSSGQLLSSVWLFVIPWTAVHQASLSITNSRSLLKLMSIELVMPSNHFIPCSPLLFPLSIFPSIRVFSNESFLHIRWPKYWSFSFSSVPPMNIQDLFPLENYIYFCFIDYAKTSDYVDHNKLWKTLKEVGIPDLTCLLRNLYAGQEATVGTISIWLLYNVMLVTGVEQSDLAIHMLPRWH